MTQQQNVVAHIAKYGSISSVEAFTRYKILRLAAVIDTLKKVYKIPFIAGYEEGIYTYRFRPDAHERLKDMQQLRSLADKYNVGLVVNRSCA
ncbi:helix-turn-helix domain-containing protein [Zooshikella sp. RANM57]|uniref:helix-turn-helix domain-containing protein n=1 Tax=Zooshikella sp. RANM57 TaxID=3425863 RepID=UPI003D6DD340